MAKGYLNEMAADGYDMEHISKFHCVMLPYMMKILAISPKSRVVDIGAGHGHGLIPLYKNGFRDLVAVDRYTDNFKNFELKFGIRSTHCNIEKDRIELEDESVDVVICLHLIEHLSSPDNLINEVHRILRKGGNFVLVTPDWRKQYLTFYRDPTHIRPYDKESIVRLLRMHEFLSVRTMAWGARWGLGQLEAYRIFPRLGLIGNDLIAYARK